MKHQALPSIFVHQRQPLEWTTVCRSVVDEVTCPHVVLEPGRLPHATVPAGPRLGAEFPGFSQPHGPLQPQFEPESVDPLEVHRMASPDQEGVDATVSVTGMAPRQTLDLPDE